MATLTFDIAAREATVVSPDLNILCQEIYDQFRDIEDNACSMQLPSFIAGAGKTDLGAIGQTVITVSLLDGWRVQFEDRGGPGFVVGTVTQGNLVGFDSLGASQYPLTDSTFVFATISQATTGSIQVETSQTEALVLLRKILDNRLETDPVAGKMTLYDDDGITPIREWDVYEDVAATQPYRSQGSERRDPPTVIP